MNETGLIAALAGFGLTLVLVRMLIPWARRCGLVDLPAPGRKDHADATPTVGGLAIVTGLLLTALLAQFAGDIHPAFWTGLVLIVLTGTADDRLDLPPTIKFAAQILAALMMIYWGGVQLHTLGELVGAKPVILDRFAVPLTIFALIGVVNAINLCDGADGLAGGLAFTAIFWIAAVGAISGEAQLFTLSLATASCVAAFLAFNLRTPWRGRAAVFLGDAGSLALGFILAWLTIYAAQPKIHLFPPVIAIWFVAIPLSDTIVCMTRRLVKGRNPFRADRTHLHHILIDLGLPAGAAVALILAIDFVLAAAGFAGWALGVREYHMFYVAMAVFALYIVLVQLGLRRATARRAKAEDIHKI